MLMTVSDTDWPGTSTPNTFRSELDTYIWLQVFDVCVCVFFLLAFFNLRINVVLML